MITKLGTVIDNVSKVYASGYDTGYGMGIASGMADGIELGIEQGKQAEYDAFWDTYQSNGNRHNYREFFVRAGWKSGTTYNPKYPMECTANSYANNMFYYSGISDTLVPITISGSQSAVFSYASSLVKIFLLNVSGVTGTMADWFTGCTNLEEINIEGEIPVSAKFADSKKLTAQSMVSIVEHLSASASGKTLTVSQTAVNNAVFPVKSQKNPEIKYDSWDALVAIKPSGWTITVV